MHRGRNSFPIPHPSLIVCSFIINQSAFLHQTLKSRHGHNSRVQSGKLQFGKIKLNHLIYINFRPPQSVPFLGEIPGGMAIGKKLHIRGQILTPEGMFNVNVQSGGAVQPRDDTPLHISIRIADQVVVLNSFEGGAWQQEERHGGRPVREGEAFELTIKAKEGYFKVEINGKKVGKFEHRLPVEMARYVHVGEGAVIESITESW